MIKRAFAWLREIIVALYIAPLKEAFIDVSGFPLGLKILTWGGYAAVFLLLLMTLFFEVFGAHLPVVHFTAFDGGEPVSKHVPTLVMALLSIPRATRAYRALGPTEFVDPIEFAVSGNFSHGTRQ